MRKIDRIQIDFFDTSIEFDKSNRIFRSLAFRYKIGPLIKLINNQIEINLVRYDNELIDVVWVDKGVMILPSTIRNLKNHCIKLIHYTPDPAFYFHKSNLFNKGLHYYDLLITTKSFEMDIYRERTKGHVLFSTQGFSSELHKPIYEFCDKDIQCCFIGHFELHRAEIIQYLIDNDIQVYIAGIKWSRFVSRNRNNPNLVYGGIRILGEKYVEIISRSYIGLGFLSTWIPEKHTTRTIEIPACGTLLATPYNNEIMSIFKNEYKSVLFYKDKVDLLFQIKRLFLEKWELEERTKIGMQIIKGNRYSYDDTIVDIFNSIENEK